MAKRYTVFHLDSERGFRGGERQLLYLAGRLRALGHENIVVCRRGEALDQAARQQGYAILHLPFWGEWDPFSAWKLRQAANAAEHTPILHAHTGHSAALAFLASRMGGPAWVVHRRVDFRLNGWLSRRFKYDAAPRVVAVSDGIRKILTECGMDPRQISVVHDALPRTLAEAKEARLQEGLLVPPTPSKRRQARAALASRYGLAQDSWIGNIAALVGHKDQETLIRAARIVLGERPDAHFFLIGDGPLRKRLERLALELKVLEKVRFVGFQSEIRPWLEALDVYAHSSWGEGMGSVLLEVMASEIPIVATRAGGIPEVLTDGRTARLVPPRAPEALARGILKTLEQPEEAHFRAHKAFEELEHFSLTRMGDRILNQYEEVTG